MKLLPLIAATVTADDCFVCKATVTGNPLINDSQKPLAYYADDHECFNPSGNSLDKYDGQYGRPMVKTGCSSCFALAYSIEYLGQNGTSYEHTMHRGCGEDYPSLELTDHKPAYSNKKPNAEWKAISLTQSNYGTYGVIKGRYMTHLADLAQAAYDSEKTNMDWTTDYGLKCYHEDILRTSENFQNPILQDRFTCGSPDATACYSLVGNYEGEENDRDVRYSYAKRGCAVGINNVPTSGSSIFFESKIPGTTVNSTMELKYCDTDGCNNYIPSWKSSALMTSMSAAALLAFTLF